MQVFIAMQQSLPRQLVIATRCSPLALYQANWIKAALLQHYPALSIELMEIKTTADQLSQQPLSQLGGKGLFVKELEEALLAHRATIAVHSIKDLPMELPPGLCLAGICKRDEPRDVLVSLHHQCLAALPPQARIGTGSLRRQVQLQQQRRDLLYDPIRGNIHTRLAKLDRGEVDALILAAAGLQRLALSQRISHFFSIDELLPAAGQGAIGIECRTNDTSTLQLISVLHDPITAACIQAERALCSTLQGGCHAPVGAFADYSDHILHVRGLIATPNGQDVLRAEQAGSLSEAHALGIIVAQQLLAQRDK